MAEIRVKRNVCGGIRRDSIRTWVLHLWLIQAPGLSFWSALAPAVFITIQSASATPAHSSTEVWGPCLPLWPLLPSPATLLESQPWLLPVINSETVLSGGFHPLPLCLFPPSILSSAWLAPGSLN